MRAYDVFRSSAEQAQNILRNPRNPIQLILYEYASLVLLHLAYQPFMT